MKGIIFKLSQLFLSLSLIFVFCACSTISPQDCQEHVGETKCQKCGLNYFDEFSAIIKNRATSVKNGEYEIEASTSNVNCIIKYDTSENKFFCSLVYLDTGSPVAVFLLTMKSGTGTTYGWALSSNDGKIVNGTFQAEDLKEKTFRPEISNNEFTEQEFLSFTAYYEESLSFCVDAIYSLLLDNVNHLTIANLGFCNYVPTVS